MTVFRENNNKDYIFYFFIKKEKKVLWVTLQPDLYSLALINYKRMLPIKMVKSFRDEFDQWYKYIQDNSDRFQSPM